MYTLEEQKYILKEVLQNCLDSSDEGDHDGVLAASGMRSWLWNISPSVPFASMRAEWRTAGSVTLFIAKG